MRIQEMVRILSVNQFPSTDVPYIVSGYLSSNKKVIFKYSENFGMARKNVFPPSLAVSRVPHWEDAKILLRNKE